MSKPRLCPAHADAADEEPSILVDPDDCDTCRLERLKAWADEHNAS